MNSILIFANEVIFVEKGIELSLITERDTILTLDFSVCLKNGSVGVLRAS